MSRILVVSPHPDDETLGAGGYLLKHKALGDSLYWLNITDMREEYGYSKERCEIRKHEMIRVKKAYGFVNMYNLRLKPAALDTYDKGLLVELVSKVLYDVKPQIVILPNYKDVHSDHKITFEVAYSCTKAFRHASIEQILCMEILSETDYAVCEDGFLPNYFVNIEQYIKEKIDIANTYISEMGEMPFPRSAKALEALAITRGAASNCKAAEAFKIVKVIER